MFCPRPPYENLSWCLCSSILHHTRLNCCQGNTHTHRNTHSYAHMNILEREKLFTAHFFIRQQHQESLCRKTVILRLTDSHIFFDSPAAALAHLWHSSQSLLHACACGRLRCGSQRFLCETQMRRAAGRGTRLRSGLWRPSEEAWIRRSSHMTRRWQPRGFKPVSLCSLKARQGETCGCDCGTSREKMVPEHRNDSL